MEVFFAAYGQASAASSLSSSPTALTSGRGAMYAIIPSAMNAAIIT